MGKYLRKCRGPGEVSAMEVSPVGVRTRSRTLALSTAGKRKRPASAEVRGSRSLTRSPEKPEDSLRIPSLRCPSPESTPASRCSSNGPSDLVQERLGSEDISGLESIDFDCREWREATSSSNLRSDPYDLESTAMKPEENSRRNSRSGEMPPEEEIEEFFARMEKNQRRRFELKYNFDVEKEAPLEGRWEWVR